MTQYKDIPQPGDQRNVSQGDILTNYRYLSTPINVAAGVPNGILPVDHYASGDNVANPTDGFHKQVSFLNRATPASLANSVNSQNSNSILYSKADGAGNAQLHLYNGSVDSKLSVIRAFVLFDDNGNIIGNAQNVTSVTKNAVGNFTVNFTVAFPNTNYLVFIQGFSNGGSQQYPASYTNKQVNSVGIRIVRLSVNSNNPAADPDQTSVQIIGSF